MVRVGADALIGPLPNVSWPKNATFHCRGDEGIAPYDGKKNAFLTAADTSGEVSLQAEPAVAIWGGMWYHIQKGEREDLFMKRILCIILSILMLLSLAACCEPEPDPEQLAFEAACALLEEGKYREAIDAFSRLESYRKVQSKIYEAEAALEAQWLASEEAAKQAELEKLGFLYGTTWHELGGTLEVTFDALMDGFFGELRYSNQRDRETVDENDGVWYFQDGNIWIGHLPGLDWEVAEELGHKAKTEERDGITHLLIGDLDFVRSEDYGAFAPVEIQITLDNWQEYFEIREGYKWEQDDFGVTVGVRIITAIVLREEYRDRTVLDLTDVTFGYTSDQVERSVSQIDFANKVAIPGGVTFIYITDEAQTKSFNTAQWHLTTDNETIAEFPRVFLRLTEGYYSPGNIHFSHRFYIYQDHVVDRVAGTLVLRAE